ncbi:DnaA regulatory inactivator Hda [Limnohabitans sp. MMS-10A-178]|uniref:DnaA regulatory inactivator Hda n=1 Tax=Limnohabitans sp. MMS-10A-178 TaxID=1835767 RepID=UPI000D3C9B1F|nr:DnaA regulatory inactivator Hda [Limnohabitans sp. MMS-10A-178]PUE17395.1 DnaA regulatory inactivator Hda [Limnohabitans sp. MMS-10A-178]
MKQMALDIGLHTTPTLDSFFAGPNSAALQHLKLWTTSQMPSPVPTYLWGESGSGKSHLLRAVQAELSNAGVSVGWLDADQNERLNFDEAWTAVLMDDVHLYNLEQQQLAFNWFVNALTPKSGSPRWVLAAGMLPPADLKLRDDLRSRLGWGHVYGLQVLSDTERRAVLRSEADARGLFLSDEVMSYMLSRFSRDLSSLMSLLDHLDQFALQTKRAITIPLIKSMLEST